MQQSDFLLVTQYDAETKRKSPQRERTDPEPVITVTYNGIPPLPSDVTDDDDGRTEE
jgi:hypothetical protein